MYKYINENSIEVATNPLFVDGVAYSNADKEQLKMLGYKDLVIGETMPVQEGYMAVPYYIDGDVITQKWKLVEYSEPE